MGQPVLVIMGRCCVEREKISSASSELVTVLHSSAGGGGDPPQVNHWAALPCWPDQSGRGGLAMLDRRIFCVCSFKHCRNEHCFTCLPLVQMKVIFSYSPFLICGRLIAVVHAFHVHCHAFHWQWYAGRTMHHAWTNSSTITQAHKGCFSKKKHCCVFGLCQKSAFSLGLQMDHQQYS